MQGAGQLAAAAVALITTIGFKDSFLHTTGAYSSCGQACQLAGDRTWRIIIGFGAVPACFALYYRITIPETPRYTFDVKHDIEKAQADIKAYVNNQKDGVVDPVSQEQTKQRLGKHLTSPKASWPDVFAYFSKWENFKVIFGTTMSWFFLEFVYPCPYLHRPPRRRGSRDTMVAVESYVRLVRHVRGVAMMET